MAEENMGLDLASQTGQEDIVKAIEGIYVKDLANQEGQEAISYAVGLVASQLATALRGIVLKTTNASIGTLTVTENGTYDANDDADYDAYEEVLVDVSNSYETTDEGKVVSNGSLVSQSSQNISANGTYDTTENNEVIVSVPNSYAAADEGKVVSNGSLVSQSSQNISANGTYDTTEKNEVVVSVPNSYETTDEGKVVSSGALITQTSRNITENGTYDTTENNEVVIDVLSGGVTQTIPNIYISSDLQIFNGWIEGFSSGSNYFQPLNSQDTVLDVDWSKPFEIGVSFKYEQTINRSMVLFGSVGGFYYAPSIEISSNSTGIWCGYTVNGSTWDNSISFSSSDGLVLQSGIKYTIKAMYDGTNYTVSIDDGTNIISKSIVVSPHYHNSNYKMGFGGIARSSNHCATYVQIYLPETYIISEGIKIWGS